MFQAKIFTPEVSYHSGATIARLYITKGNYREFFDSVDREKTYDVTIKPHRNRRSLDANAYYHVLISKIARKLGASMAEIKNLTLWRYGQPEIIGGEIASFWVSEEIDVSGLSDIHLQPTGEWEYVPDGKRRYKCIVIRGSHTYNTEEMSQLIEGTISDARDAGLIDAEIMSPSEKEALREAYGVDI